jgi:hypothetical protein
MEESVFRYVSYPMKYKVFWKNNNTRNRRDCKATGTSIISPLPTTARLGRSAIKDSENDGTTR